MGWFNNVVLAIKNPRLSYAVKTSKKAMRLYREENVFDTKSLTELLSDSFTYTGNKPNTVLVKSRKTGTAVPVSINLKTEKYGRGVVENYSFYDESGKLVGKKDFRMENHPKFGKQMYPGGMENLSNGELIGLGIRADQIQIERALENGITKISRESAAQATLFHAKMGFLPKEGELIEVSTYKEALKYIEDYAKQSPDINISNFRPIIIKKDGRFFIDLNKTQAYANVKEIKQRLKNSGSYKADFKQALGTELELSGAELQQWKKFIERQPLTTSLNFEFPKY